MFTDILFYSVFLGQIFLLSYHYPKKIFTKITYVLNTYPASKYPKLYRHSQYIDPENKLRKTARRYKYANSAIALLGLGILLAMAISGYAPHTIKENQHLLFVVFYFLLQSFPHLLVEVSTYSWYKCMRYAAKTSTRTADLRPRRLFDFISPVYVLFAVLAYIGWVSFYLYNKGFSAAWDSQTYMTMFGMAAMNLVFFSLGYKSFLGKKMDPHQADEDQHKQITTTIRVSVFASILMSLQLITFNAINKFGWDIFEPVAISLYCQLIIVFGIGEMLRRLKIEDVDFSVYKDETVAPV
ncbi:MAG: hypothetical protein COB36_13660 [Alphaproteobacteria bacterium]|nr:MAG: hypothetical protein COB36_13660 [Alphaproteobacteria bacterium]